MTMTEDMDGRCECGHPRANHYPGWQRCYFKTILERGVEECLCSGWRPVVSENPLDEASQRVGDLAYKAKIDNPDHDTFCLLCEQSFKKELGHPCSVGGVPTDEENQVSQRLTTLEKHMVTVMSALIDMGVDVR